MRHGGEKGALRRAFGKVAHGAKKVVVETPIEILIGAILVSSIAGAASYKTLAPLEGQIPVAYSGIDITLDQAQNSRYGGTFPLTRFYTANNDAVMIVFQSSNEAFAEGNENSDFARALVENTAEREGLHLSMDEYGENMDDYSRSALRSVSPLTEALPELQQVQAALDASWDESHVDHYRTEHRTRQVCSGSGETRSCHMESYTVQVYDSTTHSYHYNSGAGQEAARLMNELFRNHPDLSIEQAMLLARSVSPENRDVMSESRERMLDGRTPTDKEYLDWANTWSAASNFIKFTPGIDADYAQMEGLAAAWNGASQTAHSTSYRTGSRSDSGPAEYRVANGALGEARSVSEAAHEIVDGMRFAGQSVPELNEKIKQYIDVVLDGAEGDADALRDDIMDMARELYRDNTDGGFDVQPFKWPTVVLFTVLGAVVGAGLGFGIDQVLDNINDGWLRDRKREQEDEEIIDRIRREREKGPGGDGDDDVTDAPEPVPAEPATVSTTVTPYTMNPSTVRPDASTDRLEDKKRFKQWKDSPLSKLGRG